MYRSLCNYTEGTVSDECDTQEKDCVLCYYVEVSPVFDTLSYYLVYCLSYSYIA